MNQRGFKFSPSQYEGSESLEKLVKNIKIGSFAAKQNPINAKGIAKMVCENFIRER